MPREPDPTNDPELFDSILLGDVKSPGVVKLTGHDRKINWDVKAGKGQSGASTTLKDVPLIEFTASFYLASDEDIAEWVEFRSMVNLSVAGPKPKSMDVYHPDLAANRIHSVVLASFGGVIHDGKGGQTVTIKFQEYAPPKPKGGAPKGTNPNAKALAELAALTEEYRKTPWSNP